MSGSVDTPAFGRIAACIDESDFNERVVSHALAVADALAAPVTLLRVVERVPTRDAPLDPLEWECRCGEARKAVDRLAATPRAAAVPVDAEIVEGAAVEQICLWTRRHDIALTALCTHGASGRTPWSLASTARKLLDEVPGSVLLVPADAPPASAHYRRVLVPLDGSPRAESVLPLAIRIAAAHRAELVLVHVVPVPELTQVRPLDAEDVELQARFVRRNERVAHAYLDQIRARLDEHGLSLRAVVLGSGDARSRLVRFVVAEGIDLVVLSAHGRSGRADVPFGSVASHLIAHLAVPLLLVRQRSTAAQPRVVSAPIRPAARLPTEAAS